MRPSHRLTDPGHRVTTFELFFDLVYVFAFTQVTGWIVHEHSAVGSLQGLVVLGIVWWTWSAYAWLGNTVRADVGAPMLGFGMAMTAVFVLALAIPDVWGEDGAAPATFAAAYAVIRVIHLVVYLWVSRHSRALQRQVLTTAASWLPAVVAISVGASVTPAARLWWWGSALLADLLGTWLLARLLRGWEVRSPAHFSERYGLIVILALGESTIAVGVAAHDRPVDTALLVTAAVGIVTAGTLWWPYFTVVAPTIERLLRDAPAAARAQVATDSYTYLHLPLVAGIIVAASGIEEAVVALDHSSSSGDAATLLAVGACLVAATCAALMGVAGERWWPLATSAAVLAAGAWWMRPLHPVLAMVVVAALLAMGRGGTSRSTGRDQAV